MKQTAKLIVVLLAVFLAACGKKTVEKIYEELEKAVELEQPFAEQQQPLQEAEKKENELFTKIVQLGLANSEEIKRLVEEALASIESREAMLETEKESIALSFQQLERLHEYVERLDEPLATTLAEMIATVKKRYEAYEALYDVYRESLEEDRILFQMFLDEEATLQQIQAQIETVNELYERVDANKDRFNRLTTEYNEKKRAFYEKAELPVEFE